MDKNGKPTTMEEFIAAWTKDENDARKTCRQYISSPDNTELYYRPTPTMQTEWKERKTRWEQNQIDSKNRQDEYIKEQMSLPLDGRRDASRLVPYAIEPFTIPEPKNETIAIRLVDGTVLGNASRLQWCGSNRRGSMKPVQRELMRCGAALLPFNVFDEAHLDIHEARIIQRGGEEDLLLPRQSMSYGELVDEEVYKKIEYRDCDTKAPKQGEYHHKEEVRVYGGDSYKEFGQGKGYRYYILDDKMLEQRHFIGALLIEVGDRRFLFDIDRNEVKHYRMNPFLAELTRKVRTIKEAYDSLKPPEVKEALRRKLKVVRQGEWFFIPVSSHELPKTNQIFAKLSSYDDYKTKCDLSELPGYNGTVITKEGIKSLEQKMLPQFRKMFRTRINFYNRGMRTVERLTKYISDNKLEDMRPKGNATLQAGSNRSNSVRGAMLEKKVGDKVLYYVKGLITHDGREHEPITLTEYHRAIPNLATKSFTITGNVD